MNPSGSDLKVRLAGPEDLLGVLGVHSRRDATESIPVEPSNVEADTWAHMLAVPGLSVYLAESEDGIVGTASALLFPNVTYDCQPTAIIEAVVVAFPHRRRGIATALIRFLLEDMRSAGCNKVQLLSHKRHSGDGAHRLYTSLGIEPEAEGFRLYLGRIPDAVEEARRQ